MDAVLAEETLRDRGGSLTADEVRRLVLQATGDEAAAEEAWARRYEAELRAAGD